MRDPRDAANRLHRYLLRRHWDGQVLSGPDVGIRFNARFGRFFKSYTRFLPWSDDVVYMQAQAYWILSNWLLADLDEGAEFQETALTCSDSVLAAQRAEGYWDYPNREWKGRVATVEGCFAALALLESFSRTGRTQYWDGAQRWYEYLVNHVGFRRVDGHMAVNYFAGLGDSMVPNNTTLVLQLFAHLQKASGDDQFLKTCPEMVAFLKRVQLASGELPYAVNDLEGNGRIHFLCYQYNAFEFMDLVHYHRITSDRSVWPVIQQLAGYLSHGLSEDGVGHYNCSQKRPELIYYTASIATALLEAAELGIDGCRRQADAGLERVLSQQRQDGGFPFFSTGNYGFVTDRRSYPRSLSMILYHLLRWARAHD